MDDAKRTKFDNHLKLPRLANGLFYRLAAALARARLPGSLQTLVSGRHLKIPARPPVWPVLWTWLGLGCLAMAGPADAVATNSAPRGMPPAHPPLRKIAPGIFEIGQVRLDKDKKSVSFPGVINMDQGLIEYALVSNVGKLHESLLRTEAEPYHIHLAMLLIGTNSEARAAALDAQLARAKEDPPTAERTPFIGSAKEPVVHRVIEGEKVNVWVSWKAGKAEKRCRVEDLIFNLQTKQPAQRGSWIYNGSRLVGGHFLVQRDGSIIAIIEDLDALINNPRPGRENDEIWQVNSTNVPPVATAVQITIQFDNSADK